MMDWPDGRSMQDSIVVLEMSDFDDSFMAPHWAESEPEMYAWLDQNFDTRKQLVRLEPMRDRRGRYLVRLRGKPRYGGRIPMNARIGFQMFVTTHNDQGYRCKVDAGVDSMLLTEAQVGSTKELVFKMKTAKDYIKGKIRVKVKEVNLGEGITVDGQCLIGDADHAEFVGQEIMQYIQETIHCSKNLGDKSEILSRIRAPAYLGETGFELTNGTPLPSAAFMMYQVPISNEAFWKNSYEVVMQRHGLRPSDFANLREEDKARVMLQMSVYLPQSLPYIGDHINRNRRVARYQKYLEGAIENFGQSSVTWSGDCEDLAQGIMTTLESMQQMNFSPQIGGPYKEIQGIARNYTSFMTLCSVTSAAVGQSSQGIGAHMNVFMLPNSYVKECIQRGSPEIANQFPFNPAYMRRDLPVLTGEGTGVFESTKIGDTMQRQRQLINSMPSMSCFKKSIVHKQGAASSFYLGALTGFTRKFYKDGYPAIAFWFADENGCRGVKFTDLEQKSDKIRLVAQPMMSDTLLEICKEATKIRIPPNDLTIGANGNAKDLELSPEQREDVLVMCKNIQNQVHNLERSPKNKKAPGISVQIPASMFRKTDVEAIVADVRRNSSIYDMNYYLEKTVDGVSDNLRLEFFVDSANTSSWK